MKQKILTILAILVFLAGISLLAYPVVSNLLYEKEQEELMEHYDSIAGEKITADEQAEELQECRDYNRGLLQGGVLLTDPFDMSQLDPSAMPYAGLLNVDQEGGDGLSADSGYRCGADDLSRDGRGGSAKRCGTFAGEFPSRGRGRNTLRPFGSYRTQ